MPKSIAYAGKSSDDGMRNKEQHESKGRNYNMRNRIIKEVWESFICEPNPFFFLTSHEEDTKRRRRDKEDEEDNDNDEDEDDDEDKEKEDKEDEEEDKDEWLWQFHCSNVFPYLIVYRNACNHVMCLKRLIYCSVQEF